MKIHIKQIPVEGLHLEGEEPLEVLDLQDELMRPVGTVRYALDVGLSDGGLFATGTLGADFEMECVRCLERFIFPVEVTDFAMQMELTGAESIDLTEEIREDILLALPAHPHCDWDGAKECTGVRTTTITIEKPQAESEEKNPWTALEKLTKPDENLREQGQPKNGRA